MVIGLAAIAASARGDARRALVIVDVQKLYLSRATWLTADGKELVTKIERLLKVARENGVSVIYVQHVDNPRVPATSPSVAFADAIAPKRGELVVPKRFPSAFQETILRAELEARGITHLILVGLSSIGCLDATLREGLSLGFAVSVIADAHSAAEGVQITSGQNEVWRELGATLVWSRDVDFAAICPKAPQRA